MPQCSKCTNFSYDEDGLCSKCQNKKNDEKFREARDSYYDKPGLGELTDQHIRNGENIDNAFRYAKEDRGRKPKRSDFK